MEGAASRSAVSLEGQCRPSRRAERGGAPQALPRGRGSGRPLGPSLGPGRCLRSETSKPRLDAGLLPLPWAARPPIGAHVRARTHAPRPHAPSLAEARRETPPAPPRFPAWAWPHPKHLTAVRSAEALRVLYCSPWLRPHAFSRTRSLRRRPWRGGLLSDCGISVFPIYCLIGSVA